MADARRVFVECGFHDPGASEIRNYFSQCWGNPMDGVEPDLVEDAAMTPTQLATNKVIQSYIYFNDKAFFVSTINRPSSSPLCLWG